MRIVQRRRPVLVLGLLAAVTATATAIAATPSPAPVAQAYTTTCPTDGCGVNHNEVLL